MFSNSYIGTGGKLGKYRRIALRRRMIRKRKAPIHRRSDVSNLIVKIYHITIMLIKLFHFKRKRKGENEVLHICIIPMMIF